MQNSDSVSKKKVYFNDFSTSFFGRNHSCRKQCLELFCLASVPSLAGRGPVLQCLSHPVCTPRRCSPEHGKVGRGRGIPVGGERFRYIYIYRQVCTVQSGTSSGFEEETMTQPHEERTMSFAPDHQSVPRLIRHMITITSHQRLHSSFLFADI